MGSLTANLPKPLLPVRGRPIIEHILAGLKAAAVTEVVVVTGYRGAQIQAHLGTGAGVGMRLSYRQQSTPEGTARALLLARDALGDGPFLLSWGDILTDTEQYAVLLREFARVDCAALLAVNATDDPWRGAAVYVDAEWRVTRLIEKPPPGSSTTPWNNAGIFIFTPMIFGYAERLRPSARGEYELPQAIAAMIADGHSVRACALRGFWSDLGTPDDLRLAEHQLAPDPAGSGGGERRGAS